MIYHTSYFDKEVIDEIRRTLGLPYKLRDFWQVGAVGSSRMVIKKYSAPFKKLAESTNDPTYASIGLRPKGILVTVFKRDKNICWVIPYQDLIMNVNQTLEIFANDEFLELELKNAKQHRFIHKVYDHQLKQLTKTVTQ